nr:hypothetical protein [Tanacetum cinerariifolium]
RVPSLTPEEQQATDIMQALKESNKTSKRQLGTRGSSKGTEGSSEGTGTKPGVPDESTVVSAISNVSSLMDIPIQKETPQTQPPSAQKVPVSVIPETTNLSPIPEILNETPVSIADSSPQVTPPIILYVQQTQTPIPIPTITTD